MHRKNCCSLRHLRHVRDCMTRIACKVSKGMHEEVIGKEEKEDIVGIKDTYLWPRTSTHHQKPYQS